MELLPPGPYTLVSGYSLTRKLSAALLLLMGVGIGIGAVYVEMDAVRELSHEKRVWNDPNALSAFAGVQGNVTTHKLISKSYKLDVRFNTDDGEVSGKREVHTLFAGLDEGDEPTVRYLAEDPQGFVLSWAQNARRSRWASIAMVVVVGWFLALVIAAIAAKTWKNAIETAEAAETGMPTWCAIVDVSAHVVNGKETGLAEYSYRLPSGEERKTLSHKKHGEPVALDTELLAIVAPSGAVIIPLRKDLFPLRFPAGQHADLVAAVAARTV